MPVSERYEANDNQRVYKIFQAAEKVLTKRQLIVFFLRYCENTPIKNISVILGISYEATRERLRRALERLRVPDEGVCDEN